MDHTYDFPSPPRQSLTKVTYSTARMDYAKSVRSWERWRRGNWIIDMGKSALFSRPAKLSIREFADNTLLAWQARKRNHIKIVLLQSCGNDLCLLLLTFIFFLHFFFRILLVYLYDNEILFLVTITRNVFSVLWILHP